MNLEKTGYRFAGKNKHAAVKICQWTRNALTGRGVCYKQIFYGINSHRCLQMTPGVHFCTHKCVFCWRDTDITTSAFRGKADPVGEIVEESIKAHCRLLIGFKGNEAVGKKIMDEALAPRHVAISLAGEPTLFPRLGELIAEYSKRGFTTFLVTNGTRPQVLEKLDPLPTQLYLTLPAPDEATYKETCRPVRNHWKQILETLDLMKSLPCRKVVRLTLVKNINFKNPEGYAGLIKDVPDYVEPKAYMHVGRSQDRLSASNMPSFQEILKFSNELADASSYLLRGESEPSRVTLLCRDETAFKDRNIKF